jgi:hypothetical protein
VQGQADPNSPGHSQRNYRHYSPDDRWVLAGVYDKLKRLTLIRTNRSSAIWFHCRSFWAEDRIVAQRHRKLAELYLATSCRYEVKVTSRSLQTPDQVGYKYQLFTAVALLAAPLFSFIGGNVNVFNTIIWTIIADISNDSNQR